MQITINSARIIGDIVNVDMTFGGDKSTAHIALYQIDLDNLLTYVNANGIQLNGDRYLERVVLGYLEKIN